ncbi:MAG: D-2-hydroxyacid dehydrogenase [Oscillospiraceae bacterium]
MKIVILDGYAANPGDIPWDDIYKLGDVTLYDTTPPEQIIARIGDAEIVIVNKVNVTAEIIAQCPNLKYIGILATGYNNIDLAAAASRSIPVCNIPAYSTPSVVQHTFALLLELCMHVGEHSRGVMNGKWSTSPYFCYWDAPLTELSGKTLGLVGFGQIGKAVAKTAVCFGMNVLACAAHPRTSSGIDGVSMATLDDVLSKSDIISLHCPLTADNRELISSSTISKMKNGAKIINTARGGLINEQDVATALISGKLSGFAADVLTNEPPTLGTPLFTAPNCVITPHIAWAPYESRVRLIKIAIENVRCFIDGHPQNTVNI